MKFEVEHSALIKALGHVHRVVERRNTIPILSNVKLHAEAGSLTISGTDLDIELVETIPAMITDSGVTTVSAHLLHDIVRKMADGSTVSLETDLNNTKLVVRSGRSEFSLQTLDASDFVSISEENFTHSFEVSTKDLALIISKTQFAISLEETRYYLNGIYLHAANTEEGSTAEPVLRGVATDGHRLALIDTKLPAGAEDMPGVIIPRKTVGELKSLLDKGDSNITIDMSEVKIRFTIGTTVMVSKLIDGTFPEYQRVIPQNNDSMLEIDCGACKSSVDRVATISPERGRAVKLNIEKDKITLSVNNPESGNATDEIEISYPHDPIVVGFNAKYLLDILSQIDGDNVEFYFSAATAPTLIKDPDNPTAIYVLMPMRV